MTSLKPWMYRMVGLALYIILLTPLLAWRGFLFPQITPKILVFQSFVDVAVIAWILHSLFPHGFGGSSGMDRVVSNRVLQAMGVFLASSVIFAFWQMDPNRSFWGSNERQDGLVLWLHFLSWCALLVWFYGRNPSDAKRSLPGAVKIGLDSGRFQLPRFDAYLRFSFWVSVLVALTVLAEAMIRRSGGTVPFEMRSIIEARASGVFGNPLALGPYLLFHIFYGVYYGTTVSRSLRTTSEVTRPAALIPGKKSGEISLLGAIIFGDLASLLAILLGQTRGIAFGLAFSLLGLAVLAVFNKKAARGLRLAAVTFVLLVLLVPLAAWPFRDRLSAIPIFNRLLLMKESQSTVMRQLTWQSALQGFPEHPLIGWGHDNVYYALNKYYDPRHVSFAPSFYDSRQTWYDKSHNAYLDLLVEKGVLGTILFLLVWFIIGLELWSLKDRFKAFCLAGGFIAYLVSNAVAFDSFGSLFGLFLFLAWLIVSKEATESSHPDARPKPKSDARQGKGTLSLGLPVLKIISGAVIVLAALSLYSNVSSGVASAKCLAAQTNIGNDPVAGMSLYEDAFACFYPYAAMEKLDCATAIISDLIHNKPVPDPRGAINYAIRLMREAVAAHPQDVSIYMIMNDFYNTLALYGDIRFVEEAEAAGRQALKFSPKRQEAKFFLGRTLVLANKPFEAVALNRQMIAEYPEFPIAHWFLGLSLLAADQKDEARSEIEKAIQMGYKFQNDKEIETIKQYLGAAETEKLLKGR